MSKICPNCGAELGDGAKFCNSCGAQQPQPQQQIPQNPQPQPQQQIPQNPQPQPQPQPQQQIPQNPYMNQIPNMNQNPYQVPNMNSIPGVQNPFMQPPMGGPGVLMDEKQFYKTFASGSVKGTVTAAAVIAFLTAFVSVILLFMMNLLAIIDIVFYTIIGILILATHKWGATLAMAIYGGIFSILSLATSGSPAGIVAIIIAVLATVSLRKVSKAYKLYLATGQLPMQPIK